MAAGEVDAGQGRRAVERTVVWDCRFPSASLGGRCPDDGEQGEGSVGRTLAKEFPSAEPGAYVIQVVTDGIGTKMPAWGEVNNGPLSEDDIQNVAAYVLSLQPIGTSSEGETVQTFSGLPLAGLVVAVLAVLLVLGWLSQRQPRES